MTYCNHSSLELICDRWRAAQQQERAAYVAVVDEIMAGERAGVSEADMVRASGLARMTVRKYRRRAVPVPTASSGEDRGS